ncbi:hypothetical protein CXB51_003227 [Gossypium anomalum]|uniref:Nuclear transcription factor Y subunit n=1 Tax=Gossypium anomalum TaxID=47600 RepID=A0A8J5ZGU4_9ROSI|nr:hypothetical protein CXB51_003227 [Gossypium anomalum]
MDRGYGVFPTFGPQNSGRVMLPLNLATEDGPIYVNARQYNGIIRRQRYRAKAALETKVTKARKPYLHYSRHLHAVRRPRGNGGRFLNTKSSNTGKDGMGMMKANEGQLSRLTGSQISQVLQSDSGTINSYKEPNGGGSHFQGQRGEQQHVFQGRSQQVGCNSSNQRDQVSVARQIILGSSHLKLFFTTLNAIALLEKILPTLIHLPAISHFICFQNIPFLFIVSIGHPFLLFGEICQLLHSMAAGVAAVSSSLYNNTKPSSLFSSSIHFLPSRLSSKQLKPSNLKPKASIPFLCLLTYLSHVCPAFQQLLTASKLLKMTKAVEKNTQKQKLKTLRTTTTEEAEEDKVSESGGEEGKLYVGNLPYSMTSSELTEIFSEAGSVAKVEIVYDRVTDRSRGFGFVTMGSVDEAKEAIRLFDGSIQLDYMIIRFTIEGKSEGRTVKVNFPEVPRGGEREVMGPRIRRSYTSFIDSPYKIYAGNLGWRVTSEGLRDAFASQPGLLSAKVIYEKDTGRSRGFGFISFESAETVESALSAMNGVEVEGRPLRLNMAADRAPRTPLPAENSLERSELVSGVTV